MGFYFVDPETYNKYKDEILSYSQSIQVNTQEFLPEEKRKRPLSDKEIAEKMGWMNGWSGKYGWWRNVMPIPLTNGKRRWSSRTGHAGNTPGPGCLRSRRNT